MTFIILGDEQKDLFCDILQEDRSAKKTLHINKTFSTADVRYDQIKSSIMVLFYVPSYIVM